MTDLAHRILEQVQANLDADQLARAIVYLDRTLIPAGQRVQVGGVAIEVPWAAHLAFVDLEPGVNWGHTCRYLAVRQDADDVVVVPAQMPPYLKAGESNFRFLWRGSHAPEWAIEADPD